MARDAVHDGRVRDLKEVGDERIAADLPVKGLPELVPSRHVGSLFAAPQYLAEQDAVAFRYLLCRDEEPAVTELRLDSLNPLKVVAHRSTSFRTAPRGAVLVTGVFFTLPVPSEPSRAPGAHAYRRRSRGCPPRPTVDACTCRLASRPGRPRDPSPCGSSRTRPRSNPEGP